jgi:hypothetical protein
MLSYLIPILALCLAAAAESESPPACPVPPNPGRGASVDAMPSKKATPGVIVRLPVLHKVMGE